MSVADLLQSINNSKLNPTQSPVKFNQQAGIKRSGIKIASPSVGASVQPIGQTPYATPGSTVQTVLQNSKNNSQNIYNNFRTNNNTELAQSILKQSAGNVPTDKYGIIAPPQSQNPNMGVADLSTVDQIGKTALQGAQDKTLWQKLNQMQNLNTSSFGMYDPNNIPSGATLDNPGAQAIAVAMTAYKNHVPYVWGGNSLTKGVDCASLVQLAYAKIGIKLPRTSYEQAKSGQIIKGVQNAVAGDLIFYNTGSKDPNGIGINSHVAIYLGNGMILEAANSKAGIRKASVNYDGTPSTIVRPWS